MTREEIEKQEKAKNAFLYHTKVKHNPWNYLYYLSYLKQKNTVEYTGTESYIIGKIIDQDNSWLPELVQAKGENVSGDEGEE